MKKSTFNDRRAMRAPICFLAANVRSLVIGLGVALAAMTASEQTLAQFTDSMGGGWNNPLSASASTMIWNSIFYRTTAGKTPARKPAPTSAPAANTGPPKTAPQQTVRSADQSSVRFRSTGTRIKTKELADQLGNTPTERAQYAQLMNAVLDGFDQQAQKAGLQNDLALALGYFLAENVRIYRGLPDLTDQQFVDLRNTIAEALTSSGALANTSDRQKQEFYEGLVAYTGITQYGYEQALKAGNQAIAQSYQKVASQNLQAVTKMSPGAINIGPNGMSTVGQSPEQIGLAPASNNAIDIFQLRHDYSENAVRADQIYKGKRFLFTGTVVDVSGTYYKTTGRDETGRYIYTDIGPNLRVSNIAGTVIGWDVHCFFRDKGQMAQLRGQQQIRLEATVEGQDGGSTSVILTDAVLR